MTKTILLTDGYTIVAKETNVLLRFTENRTKVNPDTLEDEAYTFRDTWYFTTLAQALRKYTQLVLLPCETIEQVAKRLESLELEINSIKL